MLPFLSTGHYVRNRKLGFVAEYCARCRDAKPFQLFEVLSYRSFFFIPIPLPALRGHTIRCTGCKTVLPVDSARYASYIADAALPFDSLIQQTNPSLWDELETREIVQNRIVLGQATPRERIALVVEAMSAYEPDVAKRCSQLHFDHDATAAILGILMMPLASSVVMHGLQWDSQLIGNICAAQAVVLFLTAVYLTATDGRRFCRRQLFPKLLPALAVIRPTEEDLAVALNRLKMARFYIGRKVRLADLVQALATFVEKQVSIR